MPTYLVNIILYIQAMMENSVRMMLMGVMQFLALRVNSVTTTLHHWLEQNVLVLMVLLLTLIIHDALVSARLNKGVIYV